MASPALENMDQYLLGWVTLIFAGMAGVGSVVRVYQNRRLYRFHKKAYEEKRRRREDDAAR